MNNNAPIAAAGNVALSAGDLLTWLHRQRQLQPILASAMTEKLLLNEAERAGLQISNEELQQAADDFRRRNNLLFADKTGAWLADQRLSVVEFEKGIEIELLIGKLKEHVTAQQIAPYFHGHRSDFDRIRFLCILVSREDLAQELFSQIVEEGADFAELAAEHSQLAARGGIRTASFRSQLSPAVAKAFDGAEAGDTIGAVANDEGFHVFQIEEITPAELDNQTKHLIQQHLFDTWIAEQLHKSPITMPCLDSE